MCYKNGCMFPQIGEGQPFPTYEQIWGPNWREIVGEYVAKKVDEANLKNADIQESSDSWKQRI